MTTIFDLTETLEQAAALQRSGRLTEALRLFDHGLQMFPDHAPLHRDRANILVDLGRLDEALVAFDRSLALDPNDSNTHDFKAIALALGGRTEDALASLQRALELDPANANARNNCANVLKTLGRIDEALATLDRVVELEPDFAVGHLNRGNVLFDLGRFAEAAACYEKSAALQPGSTTFHVQQGKALFAAGRLEEAIAPFQRALELEPNELEHHFHLAACLLDGGQTEQAIDHLGTLLRFRPTDQEARIAIAVFFRIEGWLDVAAAYLARAARHAELWDRVRGLAWALCMLGRDGQVVQYHHRAIALAPEDPNLHRELGALLNRLEDRTGALAAYDRALSLAPNLVQAAGMRLNIAMHIHAWEGFATQLKGIAEGINRGLPASPPFILLALTDDPSLQRKCAEIIAGGITRAAGPAEPFVQTPVRAKIRVGYISRDFYDHATMLLLADTLDAHDRDRFEWFAYSYGPPIADGMRRRAVRTFNHFTEIGHLSDQQAVRLIRGDEIDIAIDLKGYTSDSRTKLLALRAAPIQVNYLGYPGTMGARFMDYIIADRVIVPDELREHYSEALVRMPASYQPNCAWTAPTDAARRVEHGLPEQAFVFCSFNQNYKISSEMFGCWVDMLHAVDNSILWLWTDEEVGRANLRARCTASGIDPQRLIFASSVQHNQHLARLACADLMLDTLPYNAHTTASDALRCGLPLLTCQGRSFAGRVASSLLTAVGLTELIAEDLDSYRERAIRLAHDSKQYQALRAKLADAAPKSSLFDPVAAARALEAAFAAMYERHVAGLPAADIDLSAH